MRPEFALLGVVLGACGVTEGQVFEPPDAAPLVVPDAPEDAGGDADPAPSDAGSASSAMLDAARPDASFEWTETLPGQGTCRAGRYVGSFSCAVTAGAVPVALEGQVSFTLRGSEETQVLEVTEGTLSDLNGFFHAGFEGSLDCLTSVFSGDSVDGHFYLLPASQVPPGTVQPPFFGFAASFVGSFDSQALVITGTWSLGTDVGGGCVWGVWGVTAAP